MKISFRLVDFHGQVWKAAEFARAIGVWKATVRRYLDVNSP